MALPEKLPTSAILTWEQVREIRRQYAAGRRHPMRYIAAQYGVSAQSISRILRNISWHDPQYTPVPLPRGGPRGEHQATAKLTWDEVQEIRDAYLTTPGVNTVTLAARYDVSKMVISKIIRNLSWTDENYTPPTQPMRKYSGLPGLRQYPQAQTPGHPRRKR